MTFARFAYGIAAGYGMVSLLPLYFLLDRIGHDAPPSITHAGFYYGFIGVTLLWQLIFILIAKDPVRFRPLMPIAIAEKFVYTVPVVILYASGRLDISILRPSLVDPVFGLAFIAAYLRRPEATANA